MNAFSRLLFLLLVLPAALAFAEAGPGMRPNIILIMADDLGYGDLGSYGQQRIQTPHLDRLAAEGTRFTQCYAGSSVCAPSRCSLMTGLHNGHNRIRDNIPHGVFLRPDDVTVAEVLKKAGYTTGAIGKWSLGNPGSWGVANWQGFDYFYGHLDQDQAHFYYPDYLWENDRIVELRANRAAKTGAYTHDLFTEKALAFVETNKDRPFFLYLPYTIPHWSDYSKKTPESQIVPSDEPYTDEAWPQTEKNFAAMITRMDRDVGRIAALVQQLGLDSNTLILFTSDNGPDPSDSHDVEFFDSNAALRGHKRDLYEGGVRVPMIARWPGKVPSGKTSEQVWAHYDLLPTLAALAGLDAPGNVDGISMLPALTGKEQHTQHEFLYWDYGHCRENYLQAVRMGDWKAVRIGKDAAMELYDLKSDPGETSDIAAAHPEVVHAVEAVMAGAVIPSPDYPIGEIYESAP
jgi:arylsulfatase A-like enzyme